MVRLFNPNDLDAIIEINRTCLPENYTPFFFMDVYQSCPDTFVVAVVQQKPVAYIMCRIEHSFSEIVRFKLARKGHIISVAVLPEYRGLGIGSDLVNGVLAALKRHNVEECFLEVRVNNNEAIRLYQKLGFRIIRRVAMYYQDGTDAFLMSRRIA